MLRVCPVIHSIALFHTELAIHDSELEGRLAKQTFHIKSCLMGTLFGLIYFILGAYYCTCIGLDCSLSLSLFVLNINI